MPFMLGSAVTLFDPLCYFLGDIFPFDIVVYHFVVDAKFSFIKLARMLIEKIGGRRFGINPLIRSEIAQ